MELSEFLLARIAEDEELGQLAQQCGWRWVQVGGMVVADRETFPARVLAECEAKRRIVKIHSLDSAWYDESIQICGDDGENMPCPTVRALALPYADHPDYRSQWKP